MESKLNLVPEIQRLKIFMENQGVSNIMLSEACKISETSISRMLNGQTKPRTSTLAKVCEVYPNLNRTWLFSGQGEMLQEPASKIDWREEAFTAVKEENTFLKKQLELLNNVVNTLLNNKNFHTDPLQVGKVLSIFNGQEPYAGDFSLVKAS